MWEDLPPALQDFNARLLQRYRQSLAELHADMEAERDDPEAVDYYRLQAHVVELEIEELTNTGRFAPPPPGLRVVKAGKPKRLPAPRRSRRRA